MKKMILWILMSFSFAAFCQDKLSEDYSTSVKVMKKYDEEFTSNLIEIDKINNCNKAAELAELEEALFNADQTLFVRPGGIIENYFRTNLETLYFLQKVVELYLIGVKNHIDCIKKAYNDTENIHHKSAEIEQLLKAFTDAQATQHFLHNTLQEPQVKEYIARLS